jgi:hypothetical protein
MEFDHFYFSIVGIEKEKQVQEKRLTVKGQGKG